MRLFNRIFPILSGLGLARSAPRSYRDTSVPMQPVPVEIERYLGLWHEVVRFPNRFERGCSEVTAEYSRRSDGRLGVLNRCRRASGRRDAIRGTARELAPGRLEVTFVAWLPFTRGAYWVLHVDPEYSFAVVGEPSGRTGWVLSRSPELAAEKFSEAISVLEGLGYDCSRLERAGAPAAP